VLSTALLGASHGLIDYHVVPWTKGGIFVLFVFLLIYRRADLLLHLSSALCWHMGYFML